MNHLPSYKPLQSAFHRAHEKVLREMVNGLPITPGDRILDMACGEGFYTPWLAERATPAGEVVAVDQSAACLREARKHVAAGGRAPVRFVRAKIERLPFKKGRFDLIWCAQSLYSLPDPVSSLRALRRVLKPGGFIAILEDDSLHHVLLSWPADVELALREAEFRCFERQSHKPPKYYVGRKLNTIFLRAGLRPLPKQVYAKVWESPFSKYSKSFLRLYLNDLKKRVWLELAPAMRRRAAPFFDENSSHYLVNQPDLSVTLLDYVMLGKR